MIGTLTIKAGPLTKALKAAGKVIERRNTIPILSCVRVCVSGGHAVITASNLDIVLDVAAGPATGEGAFACSHRDLLALARFIAPDHEVTFAPDGADLWLAWPGAEARLMALPIADFPVMPLPEKGAETIECGPDVLRSLRQVQPAISTEETRYYLNGAHLDVTEGKAVFVATDGHRMQVRRAASLDAMKAEGKPIFPRRLVGLWLDLAQGEHFLTLYPRHTVLQGDGWQITAKLIDGTFPAWRRIITKGDKSLEVLREPFLRAIAMIAAASHERSKFMAFAIDGGQLFLEAGGIDSPAMRLSMGAAVGDLCGGEPLGLNAALIQSAAAQIEGDRLILRAIDGGSPISVEAAEQIDGEHSIVMPMRVGGSVWKKPSMKILAEAA